MQNLAIWKQAGIYLAIFLGIESYFGLFINLIRTRLIDSELGGYNMNFNPLTNGVALGLSIITLALSVLLTSKIINQYLPLRETGKTSLLATLFYLILTIVPAINMTLLYQSGSGYLMSGVGWLTFGPLILSPVLFYIFSRLFLRTTNKINNSPQDL